MLRLRGAACLVWAAPVCSSFVWVARSSTGRSRAWPYGNLRYRGVRLANQMMVRTNDMSGLVPEVRLLFVRTCLILEFAAIRGQAWVCEQPSSSVLFLCERFQSLLRKYGGWRINIKLGRFGSATPKMLTFRPWIYTICFVFPCVASLCSGWWDPIYGC